MSPVNVPVVARSASVMGLNPFDISDRSAFGLRPSIFTLWGLLPALVYITTLVSAGTLATIPYFRRWLRNKLQTYSFAGNPNGAVVFDAQATSKDGHQQVSIHLQCPGDPGIYATGLFAAAIALTLLKAAAPDSKCSPKSGFNPPVAALQGNANALLDQLDKCGARICVQRVDRTAELSQAA